MYSSGRQCCLLSLRAIRQATGVGERTGHIQRFATSSHILGKVVPTHEEPALSKSVAGNNATSQDHLKDVTDLYVVCNHGLPDADTIQCESSEAEILGRYSSCGHCNILGYNSQGYGGRNVHGDRNGHYDSRIDLHGSASIYGSRSSAAWNTRSVSHHRTMGRHFSGIANNFSRRGLSMYSSCLSTAPADANWIVIRSVHSESKAEQTVKALKSEAAEKKTDSEKAAEVLASEPSVQHQLPAADQAVEPVKPAEVAPVKKSLGQRIIHEVKHYYNGFKLLFIDFRVCSKLLWQLLNGKSLSRRERRQLVRTSADFFRLLPFSVFIIVPFMEFLLPVALKLFPGMLPSTFKEADKEREKLRTKLKLKLEMAKFLQDTIEETALQKKGGKGESAQEFSKFLTNIRESGDLATNEEILKYSKLFEDEFTLDNLTHGQLRALCQLVDIQTVGTSNFLRFQLRLKMRQLETDDMMIKREGLDSLAVWELQEASRARGMRALGVPVDRLKLQLQQWLDLHLNNQIPTSLLLLSRTLYMPEEMPAEEKLKATIQQLPETTAGKAKVKISEVTGDRIDNKTKLEIIKQEEEAIRKEKEERQKEEEELQKEAEEEQKKKELEDKVEAPVLDEVMKEAAEPISPSIVDSAPTLSTKPEEILVDKAKDLSEKEEEKQQIDTSYLEKIEEVLEHVAAEKHIPVEAEELKHLKEDITEHKEALEDLKEVVVATGSEELKQSKAAIRLSKRVDTMVTQLESLMGDVNKDKAALMEDIEVKEVKIKRSLKLQEDSQLREQVQGQIMKNKESLVSMNELLLAMRRLQKVPDDDRLEKIAQVLDEDQDGKIDVNDALRVIELLGQENIKLSTGQIKEIMALLRREEQIELEEREKRVRGKLEKAAREALGQPGVPPPEVSFDRASTEIPGDTVKQKKQDEMKQ